MIKNKKKVVCDNTGATPQPEAPLIMAVLSLEKRSAYVCTLVVL